MAHDLAYTGFGAITYFIHPLIHTIKQLPLFIVIRAGGYALTVPGSSKQIKYISTVIIVMEQCHPHHIWKKMIQQAINRVDLTRGQETTDSISAQM